MPRRPNFNHSVFYFVTRLYCKGIVYIFIKDSDQLWYSLFQTLHKITTLHLISRCVNSEKTLSEKLHERETLKERCPYLEFFCSVLSQNAGKYDQENSEYGHSSRSENV